MPPRERKRPDSPRDAWISVQCPTCRGKRVRGNGACGLCSGTGVIEVPPLEDTLDY